MEYDEMRAMEKTHCCAQCTGVLNTTWNADSDDYSLVCGVDKTHTGYRSLVNTQTSLQRGDADRVIGPGAQKDLERRARETNFAFSMLPKVDAGDRSIVDLGKVDLLIKWADSVGLNAFLGHVELYYGEPRVSIDGYYYRNNKREKPYRLGTSPMSKDDRAFYTLEEGDFGSLARAYLDGNPLPEYGIGIVKAHELTDTARGKPDQKRYPIVAEHPQRLAEKRAEWQLLRKLIPLEVIQ